MQRIFKSRMAAVVALTALLFATTQCGARLYPERVGQPIPSSKSFGEVIDKVDTNVLIMDCLWLWCCPGFVGAIFLIKDFGTGAIYKPTGAVKARPKSSFLFRLPNPAPADAQLVVTLEDPSGVEVIATLLEKDVAQGEEVGEVMLRFPEGISSGDYRLAVKVNGETQAAWTLSL